MKLYFVDGPLRGMTSQIKERPIDGFYKRTTDEGNVYIYQIEDDEDETARCFYIRTDWRISSCSRFDPIDLER